MALRAPRERDQRHQPEERVDDGDPIQVIPRPAPGKKRPPTVGALPVHIEMAEDCRRNSKGKPIPRWHGDRSSVTAQDPARYTPPQANDERETDDFHDGTDKRVSDAAMEHQEVGAGSRQSDKELAQIGRVRRHDAEQRGARHVTIGHGTHQRRADEGMSEIVHTAGLKVDLLRLLRLLRLSVT